MAETDKKVWNSPRIRHKVVQMNKEMIMETAARLFAESSYEGTSLDDIATKIGATKGLIYHYFPSKGVLLGELLLWIHGLFLEKVEPAYKRSHASKLAKFKDVVKAHIDYNYQYLHMISIIYRTLDSVPPVMRRRIRKLRLAYLSQFISLVEQVQDSGKLIQGDSEEITVSILTLINYMPFYLRNVEAAKRDRVFQLVVQLYCR